LEQVKGMTLGMTHFSWRAPQVFVGIAVTGVVLVAVGMKVFRKKPSMEEIERDRRRTLVQSGRIVDGTVLDINELLPSESNPNGLKLILYKYQIAGVVYECSQDISPIGGVDLYATRVGFPCSVRYEPHNPQNSIVIAENWSGLRDRVSRLAQKNIAPQPQ
jgi:hypothetical protein